MHTRGSFNYRIKVKFKLRLGLNYDQHLNFSTSLSPWLELHCVAVAGQDTFSADKTIEMHENRLVRCVFV